jgi:hypothetical protein
MEIDLRLMKYLCLLQTVSLAEAYAVSSCSFAFKSSIFFRSASVGSFFSSNSSIKSRVSSALQNRVNQAVMNFEKGNIGVKDGTAIHRQGLYKLNDIVQKLRDDPYSS